MKRTVIELVSRLEVEGKKYDACESEHSKRFLNLETETAQALVLLLRIAGVRNLLEIGTSNGYSTIWIASTLADRGGHITSIERDAKKQQQARENLAQAELFSVVDLLLGDATEIAASLSGPFDCVFFDADRVSAPRQLDLLLPKLAPRALLLADNALSHPDQIAAYLAKVSHLEYTSHAILAIGKGLSVAWRELPTHTGES
jgi:predicted O-methyltransferase YrrM